MKDFLPVEGHSQTTSQSCLLSAEQNWLSQQDFFFWALLWPFQTLQSPHIFFWEEHSLCWKLPCAVSRVTTLSQGLHPISSRNLSYGLRQLSSIILECCCPNRCSVPVQIAPICFFSPFSLLPDLSLSYQVQHQERGMLTFKAGRGCNRNQVDNCGME